MKLRNEKSKVHPNSLALDEEMSLAMKQKKPVEISMTCKNNRLTHLPIIYHLLQRDPLNLKKNPEQMMKNHSVRRYMKLPNQKKQSCPNSQVPDEEMSANKAEKPAKIFITL